MTKKFKNNLTRLLLALTLTIATAGSLAAQITIPSATGESPERVKYVHQAFYDDAGNKIATYEGIYIPPVVIIQDGRSNYTHPGLFYRTLHSQ